MLWLLTLLGLVLLAVLCLDVYATVFVPTGQPGPLSGRLYRRCWHLWHRRFGDGSARSRHHLARVGPLLVPLTVLVWAALLWLGFTVPNRWSEAMHFSASLSDVHVVRSVATVWG